jgi:ribosomal protein L16/L10AE
MLIPRRVKHRKQHHPRRTGSAKGGTTPTSTDAGRAAVEENPEAIAATEETTGV